MASPFIYGFTAVGSLFAARLLWGINLHHNKMFSSVTVLMLSAVVLQPLENKMIAQTEYFSQTSTIEINSDPQTVFKYIPAHSA